MDSKMARSCQKSTEILKNLKVTSKCIAIVFVQKESGKELNISGREILEEFKSQNKSCFWNPALVESIDSLCYQGFVEPSTVLVRGHELHLENLRTAWGRRVLKDPKHFSIQRIGDISGIEMAVVPRTNFIPLPEVVCNILQELNQKRIIATLDVIYERLKQTYSDLQPPSIQLLYETLGTLITERKVFHSGNGYSVVTPDTYRLPGDGPQDKIPLSWQHYNQMYIPVLHKPQMGTPTQDHSCQVSLVNQPIGQTQLDHQQRIYTEFLLKHPQKLNHQNYHNYQNLPPPPPPHHQQHQMAPGISRMTGSGGQHHGGMGSGSGSGYGVDREGSEAPSVQVPTRLCRSRSLPRNAGKTEAKKSSIKRSNSIKGNTRLKSSENGAVNKVKEKGEKKSLFSKIFGKKDKKKNGSHTSSSSSEKVQHSTESQPKTVEHVTFSGQFPPPEWAWYQQQVAKQERTFAWLWHQKHSNKESDYMNMDGAPSSLNSKRQSQALGFQSHQKLTNGNGDDGHYCEIDTNRIAKFLGKPNVISSSELYLEPQTIKGNDSVYYTNYGNCLDFPAADQYVRRRHSESHRHRHRRHQVHSGEWSHMPSKAHQAATSPRHRDGAQDIYDRPRNINNPMFSSTPKEHYGNAENMDTIHNTTIDEMYAGKIISRSGKHHHHQSTARRRRRHGRHHHQSSVQNVSQNVEYHVKNRPGKLRRSTSCDSGVNCHGVEKPPKLSIPFNKGHSDDEGMVGDDEFETSFSKPTTTTTTTDSGYSEDQKPSINLDDTTNSHKGPGGQTVVCVADINQCVGVERYIDSSDEQSENGLKNNYFTESPENKRLCYNSVDESVASLDGENLSFGIINNNDIEKDRSFDCELDSLVDESEQSYETVIESPAMKKINLCQKVSELSMADSGISSPRTDVSEELHEKC